MDIAAQIMEKLDRIRDLPTLPVVVQKISETTRNPNADATKIAQIISDDPAIMARILKVVNSPLYAGREPITSVQQAVARMGMRTISSLAVSTSVFSAFKTSPSSMFSREEFWKHSISVGIAAQVIQVLVREKLKAQVDLEILRLAGLLHDIGKILLEQHFHDEFTSALTLAREENITLIEAERRIISTDHAQIGAWLGVKWKLSNDLMTVIRRHHSPLQAEQKHKPIVYLCHVANFICNQQQIGHSGETPFPAYEPGVWDELGLTLDSVPAIMERLESESAKSEILASFAKE